MLDPQDRILKLEERIEKIGDTVTSVDIKLEKMITKVDLVLDNHDTKICEHEKSIQELKDEVKSTKFFKTTWGKVVGFISAILIIIFANLIIDYVSSKTIPNQNKIEIVQK